VFTAALLKRKKKTTFGLCLNMDWFLLPVLEHNQAEQDKDVLALLVTHTQTSVCWWFICISKGRHEARMEGGCCC